jgi:CheY-like chemotaxis protein
VEGARVMPLPPSIVDPATVTRSRPYVLLAEDERALRELMVEALVADGFSVVPVEDGRSLLRVLDRGAPAELGQPALLVTDDRMPRLSGLDALALAHEIPPSVPVVVITAFGDATIHARAWALCACAVLDKPFPMPELLELARRLAPRPLLEERSRTIVPGDWPCAHELEPGPELDGRRRDGVRCDPRA